MSSAARRTPAGRGPRTRREYGRGLAPRSPRLATDPRTDAPARLLPLSAARLAGNGLFRFVYPFLGVVAVDVGLGAGAEGLLITGLAVGGMLVPAASGLLGGGGDAPRRQTTAGLVSLFLGTVLLGLLAPALASTAGLGIAVGLLGTVVLGVAKPVLDVGSMAYVSARVPWARRGRALSTMELTWAGGLLVLAPVGALADVTSWRVGLVLLGVVALAAVPLLRRWLDPDEETERLRAAALASSGPTSAGGDAPPTEPHTGATTAAEGSPGSAASAWRFLATVVLVFVALEATFGVVGLWLEDVRMVELRVISLFTAVGAVGELAGSALTVAASDRFGKARTFALGLVACALGFGLLGVAEALPLALAGLALGLFGTETAIVAAIALGSEIEPARRSAFLSRMVAASSISRATLGVVGPGLLLRGGIAANTRLSVVAALLALVLLVDLVRRDPRLHG